MALIHDILYQTEDFNQISLQAYLTPLAEHLKDVYNRSDTYVEIDLKADQINLPMGQAVPCGLIAVELISNALKYARPASAELIITIRANPLQGRYMEMRIGDNGDEHVKDFQIANPDTLGIQIVSQIILGQLEGTYEVDVSQGVIWKIVWPL